MAKPLTSATLTIVFMVGTVFCLWQAAPAFASPSQDGAKGNATGHGPEASAPGRHGVSSSASGNFGSAHSSSTSSATDRSRFSFPQLPKQLTPADKERMRGEVKAFTASLTHTPEDVSLLAERARCYVLLGDPDHAAQDCDKALSIKPDSREAAYAAYLLVRTYVRDLDEDKALHFYDLTIGAYPQESRLYSQRGELLHGMGKNKQALADQNKAIALDPENGDAYYSRGEIECSLEDLKAALADFGRAAPLVDSKYIAYYRQCQCYESLGDFKGAAATYSKMIPLQNIDLTDRLRAVVRRGVAYQKLGQDKQALNDFSTVIATPRPETMKFERNNQATEEAIALQGRATIYESLKKYDLAIKDYTRLISLDEEWGQHTPQRYSERAKLYRLTGKIDLANRDEALAKKMTPHKN